MLPGRPSRPPFSLAFKVIPMPKVAPPTDKNFLRSLHREIDLFDRKIA
jgi:hypothetical protein